MVSFSSRLALKALLSDMERAQGQRRRVYETVRDWKGEFGPSREDIARATGLRLSSVCGRVKELLDDGAFEKGPMKLQEAVPGRALEVETLLALAYREPERTGQLEFL